jgi:hypothetical protein
VKYKSVWPNLKSQKSKNLIKSVFKNAKTPFSFAKEANQLKKMVFLPYDSNADKKLKKLAAFHSLLEGK